MTQNQLLVGLFQKKALRLTLSDDKNYSSDYLSFDDFARSKLRKSRNDKKIKSGDFYYQYNWNTNSFRIATKNGTLIHGNLAPKKLNLELYPEDQILGFGNAFQGLTRVRGQVKLLNQDTIFNKNTAINYSSFPFFIVKKREKYYGLWILTSLPVELDLRPTGLTVSVDTGQESYVWDFLTFSGTPEEILRTYSDLSGRPFFPPIWSIGFHQSRWSYKSQKRVLQIAKKFRTEDLPCDAIHLDIHYMDAYKVFTWHPKRFADPRSMNNQLKSYGLKSVAVVDPGVKMEPDYEPYEKGLTKDVFCKNSTGKNYEGKTWSGKTVFPDFSSQKAQDYWAQCHEVLLSNGIAGIWNDMNDPVLKIGKQYDPFAEDITHELGPHRKYRNIYANLQAKATTKAFSLYYENSRPFILTKSAHSGIQKYAALWTGDNASRWADLRENLYSVINLSLSGVPFCGANTGGFAGGKGLIGAIKFRKQRKLFSRWMELGSLMPFFRAHTVQFSPNVEPWEFGKEVLANSRKHIKRRYRLMPYLYSLFLKASLYGSPIVRPLFYNYPELESEELRDQFMLGDSILAAPVLYPDLKRQSVFLPPGNWFEFETGEMFLGNTYYEFHVRAGYFPLFVKAGTILPMCNVRRNAEESIKSAMILEVFPDTTMYGDVYLDDGISNDYKSGVGLRYEFYGKQAKETIKLKIKKKLAKYQNDIDSIYLRLPTDYKLVKPIAESTQSIKSLENEDRNVKVNEIKIPITTKTVIVSKL